MKVLFKNGREISVSLDVVERLKSQITGINGAGTHQFFSDNETGYTFLMINIDEIVFITSE